MVDDADDFPLLVDPKRCEGSRGFSKSNHGSRGSRP
jgi:hypothetical protein